MAKKQTEEISVIENQKLTELAKESGVEKTKAELHVSAFHPSLAKLGELSRQLAELDKANPTKEHAAIAKRNRLDIVKIRTGAEGIKDERKKVLLAEGNLIQSAYNLVKDACIVTEAEYEEVEKFQERREAEAKARLHAERVTALIPFETNTAYLPLGEMDEDAWNALYSREKEAHEAIQAKREQDRVAAEKAEAERLVIEEQARIEREEEEKRIREENELLRKEKEATELLNKQRNEELRPYIVYIRDYAGTLAMDEESYRNELINLKETERLEKEQELERVKKQAELDRLAAERENALAQERAKSKLIEQQLLEKQIEEQRIKNEQMAAEKAAKMAPDKEKYRMLFESIKGIQIPEFQTEEARTAGQKIKEALEIVWRGMIEEAKKLA